jgi:hypothetical protein
MRKSTRLRVSELEERCMPIVGRNEIPTALVPGDGNYEAFSGVVQVAGASRDFGGSGSLIRTNTDAEFGFHILTAAHVVADATGKLAGGDKKVYFDLARGLAKVSIPITVRGNSNYITLAPGYAGKGNWDEDIAVLKIADQKIDNPNRYMVPPFGAKTYSTKFSYVDDFEGNFVYDAAMGQQVTWSGYGMSGAGGKGQGFTVNMNGDKRMGHNKIEIGSWGNQSAVYGADFDNGEEANDAFGVREWFQHDLGLGDNEVRSAPGDSGMPWFVNIGGAQYVVGVHVAGEMYPNSLFWDQPDIDVSKMGTFGEVSIAHELANSYHSFLLPATKIGDHDVVLDMEYQVYGRPGVIDNLEIIAININGFLELWVDGPDGDLDGLYYRTPVDKLSSLTIRGSGDNETFRIIGDLGIGGNVYIESGGGKDKIEFDDSTATGRRNYTFENKGDAGYTMRLSRAYGADAKGLPAIDSVGISEYILRTGSGEDHIRVEHAPTANGEYAQGIHIFANGGDDKVYVGIENAAGGMSNIVAYVTVDGGPGANDFFAFDATGEDSRHDYTLNDKAGIGYTYRLNRALGEPAQGISPVDTVNFSMFTLSASPGVDRIRVENVPSAFTRGTCWAMAGTMNSMSVPLRCRFSAGFLKRFTWMAARATTPWSSTIDWRPAAAGTTRSARPPVGICGSIGGRAAINAVSIPRMS